MGNEGDIGKVRKVFLVLAGIILGLLVLIFVILLTGKNLFYPRIYLDALEENNFYGNLESSIGELINSNSETPVSIPIGEETLKTATDSALDNFLSYIRGDTDKLSLEIEIDSATIKDFLENQVETLPKCGAGKTPNEEMICIPANVNISEFIDNSLNEENITLPEGGKIDLAEMYNFESKEIQSIRKGVRIYQTALYVALFLIFIFAGLMFWISKDWRRGMITIGISMVISGLIVVIVSLNFASLSNFNIPNVETFNAILASVINTLFQKIRIYGFIFLSIGVILISGSFVIRRKEMDN